MKRLLEKLFKNDYLLNQLMQLYSLLLVGIILLTVAAFCVFTGRSDYTAMTTQAKAVTYQIDSYVSNMNDAVSNMVLNMTGTTAKMENMRNYLKFSPPEYFEYTIEASSNGQTDVNFPATLSGLFTTYPDLEELYIKLDEFDKYLVADRKNPNGQKRTGEISTPKGLTIIRILQDEYTGQQIGEIYAVFSQDKVLGNLADSADEKGIDSFIFDSSDELVFSAGSHVTAQARKLLEDAVKENRDLDTIHELTASYYIRKSVAGGQHTSVLLTGKSYFWLNFLRSAAVILSVGCALAVILLLVLKRTFKRYSKQVAAIVNATENVSDGNLKERIDTSKFQDELFDLATAVNFMVASLDQYIEDIYTLEIKQRDANMRALQSQINPHFLYNTLEYIRMYALSRQQEELADVVFAFSSLLRNNTTQEKMTTLERELSFCEKYVYLCQMRYPDQIAYHFELADELKKIQLPKFVIQPLVENYFVHGIDYTRNDNALSIKVFKKADQVVIKVSDNGKGMTAKRLQEVREKLSQPDVDMTMSIGLRNVHERLKSYLGSSYQMTVDSKENQGTTIVISFTDDGGN